MSDRELDLLRRNVTETGRENDGLLHQNYQLDQQLASLRSELTRTRAHRHHLRQALIEIRDIAAAETRLPSWRSGGRERPSSVWLIADGALQPDTFRPDMTDDPVARLEAEVADLRAELAAVPAKYRECAGMILKLQDHLAEAEAEGNRLRERLRESRGDD